MKNEIKYLVAASLLALTLITGCSGNKTAQNVPGTPDYNMSQRITTKMPGTTGTNTTGNNAGLDTNMNGIGKGLGADLNNLTNDGYGKATDGLLNNNTGFFGSTTRAPGANGTTGATNGPSFNLAGPEGICQAQINKIAGVNNSQVLFSGNTAYVACNLNNAAAPRNINDNVVAAIKAANPSITQCYISTDNERFNQVRAISKCVSQDGYRPVYTRVLNDTISGMTPVSINR